jgi:hypothetical protein
MSELRSRSLMVLILHPRYPPKCLNNHKINYSEVKQGTHFDSYGFDDESWSLYIPPKRRAVSEIYVVKTPETPIHHGLRREKLQTNALTNFVSKFSGSPLFRKK